MTFDPSTLNIQDVNEIPDALKTGAEKKADKPPKKRKLKYSASKYKNLPPTKVINKAIIESINENLLTNKPKKMSVKECEIGEAMMYMMDYYLMIDINHPAVAFMGAAMGLGFATMNLMQQPDALKKGEEAPLQHEDETVTIKASL